VDDAKRKAKRRRDRRNALERAKWLRQMLVRTLGGKCESCGSEDMSILTIDHRKGIQWDRYKLRADARVARYIAEYCDGVPLRCLCLPCNGRHGRPAQEPEPGENDVTDQERADAKLESYGLKVEDDAPF
jgi:hypothetical protein